MAFQPGIAYGVAIVTAIVLGCMAVRNQQSGWRKSRTNGVMDILMAWAEAQAESRQAPQQPAQGRKVLQVEKPVIVAPTATAAAHMSGQLASLMTALNVHSGVTPVQSAPAEEKSAVQGVTTNAR